MSGKGNYGTLLNFQLPFAGVADKLGKVNRNDQSRFWESDGRVGSLHLLLLLFLLVRGKELFPERRLPRTKAVFLRGWDDGLLERKPRNEGTA